jgi:glycosyltransferase involved in cell wall biosynthesis
VATETQLTLSGQFFDFCRDHGLQAYAMSSHPSRGLLRDGPFIVENRPKLISRPQGLSYHLNQILSGLSLISSALRFGAHIVVVDSGATHWFMLSLLKLARVRVIASIHNTFWPNGFLPSSGLRRTVIALDGWFWRNCADATLCVSPECQRQVETISAGRHGPIFQFRAQYLRELFEAMPPPPQHEARPFRVLFVGRVERAKGVFDLLEIAERLERKFPGQFTYDLCGSGNELEGLKTAIQERALGGLVRPLGRVSREDLVKVYGNSHVVIIPTTSSFTEGMPAVASEAVLTGRPLITSRLSNALDVLEGAVVEALPDDPESYVQCLERLLTHCDLYERCCAACLPLRKQFCDRSLGWTAAMEQAVGSFDGRQLVQAPDAGSP